MSAGVRSPAALLAPIAGALCLSLLALASPAHGALSPSAYRVGRLCASPPPGYFGCLGLRLIAKHPRLLRGARESTRVAAPSLSAHPATPALPAVKKFEFSEPWAGSLSPQNVQSAYSLSGLPAPAAQQTLALVDAFDDPTVEQDLQTFDTQYGLPTCTTANGCFTKVKLGSPKADAGWAQEIATDVEVAHGVCESCRILLVEARSNSNADLESAEERAVQLGASEISNSWGGSELGVTPLEDETDAFNHPGVVITASSGDNGYLDWDAEELSERGFADYPASSPHVVAVGGTRLTLTAGGAWREETVWNGDGAGGGGCSTVLAAPAWQQSTFEWSAVGCGSDRAVADVSADADPYTGVAVYDSTPITEGEIEYRGWVPIGGTSVASPIIAATFALAGGAGTDAGETVAYPARTLYKSLAADPAALHDLTVGSNGACDKGFDEETGASNCSLAEQDASCSAHAICLARVGYDGPTGVGTPNGLAAFMSAGEAERVKQAEQRRVEEEKQAAEKKAEEEKQAAEEAGQPGASSESGSRKTAEATSGQPNAIAPGALTGPLRSPGLATVAPVLSAPTLTKTATAALRHHGPRMSQIAFAFTLNVAARVHVTLARRIDAHGRGRWQTLPYSLTLAAPAGRSRAHLSARGTLTPGRYRLTLTPARGTARSLTFLVG